MKLNRRDALHGVVALAAGLFAAPAAVQAKPARSSRPRAWNEGLTPKQARQYQEEYGLMLAAVLEVQEALEEADADADEALGREIAGLQYHFGFYFSILDGMAPRAAERLAQALADRRRQEGPPDPVWRVELALDRLKAAAAEVLDRHAARDLADDWEQQLHEDCQGIHYAAGVWYDLWQGEAEEHLSPESLAERRRQLIADFEADPEKYLAPSREPSAD